MATESKAALEGQREAFWPEHHDASAITAWTIYPAPAEKANGGAVLVCPGGGYGHLALGHEGIEIAEWLNERGIAALVLEYRVAPYVGTNGTLHPAPLEDAQRALRTIRARAGEWNLDKSRIGIWGFSAGGHLASSVGTHFDAGEQGSDDPVEQQSSRPDFMILSYPVISFSEFVHEGSCNNLLGADAAGELIELFSNELQVTPQTPPTFIFHTDEDPGVPAENSVLFYLALRRNGVPAEMHIYEMGRHGLGLAQSDPIAGTWTERLADWLTRRGL